MKSELEDIEKGSASQAEDEDPEPDDTDGAGGESFEVAAQQIDELVAYNRIDITVDDFEIVDLDAQQGTLDSRTDGLEVNLNATAFNGTDDTKSLGFPLTLVWTGPSGSSEAVFNQTSTGDGVPSNSQAALEYSARIDANSSETFDAESAYVRFGVEGANPVQVPLGSQAELVTGLPRYHEDLVGKTIDFGNVKWEIDFAMTEYQMNNARTPDGETIFEMDYTFVNDSDTQQCAWRGKGNNFALKSLETQNGSADLGTARCVSGGDSEQFAIGITLPSEEVNGLYELTGSHEYYEAMGVKAEEKDVVVEFEMSDEEITYADLYEKRK